MTKKLNIAHIIPGSGEAFYCGNCLRDSKFFEATRAQGHNVIKIPMYLPLFSNDHNGNEVPVFYGAVSLYLKQRFPVFRYMPGWFDNLLNSKPMLRFAAKRANSTRAKGLEEMTISMLMGEYGKQKMELEKMVHWLETHFKADVIHISNALLLGLAHKIKERLNVPVICSLQDEDVWVDVMEKEFSEKVWRLMQLKSSDIDLFVSVSHFYSSFMKEKLNLDDEKLTTLYLGVDPDDYHYAGALEKDRNIGFLSRLCKDNGLDILVDAFIILKENPENSDVKLILTGGHTGDDIPFIRAQKHKISRAGLTDDVEFIQDFCQDARNNFFDRIAVMSVPVRHGEAFGIYLTEAMAAGVPVVQPAVGAFSEIVERSGGGVIYPENTPEMLADNLTALLNDTQKLQDLSAMARKSVIDKFNIHELANEMTKIYMQTIENFQNNNQQRS